MFRFDDDLRIYLHREPIDFRAGLNTLVTLVEQAMQLDPLARAVYAFHNRKRDRVNLLLYDRAGFWLMMKRLEADRFVWPHRQQDVIELTTEQLHLLLDGVDVDAMRRHPTRQYCHELTRRVATVAGRHRRAPRLQIPVNPFDASIRYCGSHEGPRSLPSSRCGVEPHAYLMHILTELPQRAPEADISDLLPFNYDQRKSLGDAKRQPGTSAS